MLWVLPRLDHEQRVYNDIGEGHAEVRYKEHPGCEALVLRLVHGEKPHRQALKHGEEEKVTLPPRTKQGHAIGDETIDYLERPR